MTDTACPSLIELDIEPGSFIRKLDKLSHWNGNAKQENIDLASQAVAAKVFNEKGEKYSLWQIRTEADFYGVVASLTANANPKDRDIDFIWISKIDLDQAGIVCEPISEGLCFHVKDLHFDAVISSHNAQLLCHILLAQSRLAKRCKKAHTIAIREQQKNLGCKAVDFSSTDCQCEES